MTSKAACDAASPRAAGRLSSRPVKNNISGIGRVYTWQGASLWIGRHAGRTAPHDHHAIQITLALGTAGSFHMRGASDSAPRRFTGAVVMPHYRHEFDGLDGSIAHIFVEPETTHGYALKKRFAGNKLVELPVSIESQARALSHLFESDAGDAAIVDASRRIIDDLTGAYSSESAVDARIAAAISFIADRLTSTVSLTDVAAAVHLSPSRFRHLFVKETGTAYRAYVLWLRINRAASAMHDGNSWTEAAHAAGFADSAHMSRTFRRVFGVAPATLKSEENKRDRPLTER
jgi:AraC family transcriptional regulator